MSELSDFVDKLESKPMPRLLVEGINTDLTKDIKHRFGKTYTRDMLVPSGQRAVYILEWKAWQGDNGSEEVSDLIIDLLVFNKSDLSKAYSQAVSGKGEYAFKGERIRDDGFWEDGMPCFDYNHIKDVNITLNVILGLYPLFLVQHDSNIKEREHPAKHNVDYEENLF